MKGFVTPSSISFDCLELTPEYSDTQVMFIYMSILFHLPDSEGEEDSLTEIDDGLGGCFLYNLPCCKHSPLVSGSYVDVPNSY